MCASLRVLALELGIAKFKPKPMIYLMCQMPPEANVYVSVSYLLLIIISNSTIAAAPASRLTRVQ